MFDTGRLTFRPFAPANTDVETWPLVSVVYTYPGIWAIFRQMGAGEELYEEARVTDERMLPRIVAALLGQPIDEEQHD